MKQKCQNCYTIFSDDLAHKKVKHHDHYNNGINFIKTICNTCNLAIQAPRLDIPAFAHNFLGLIQNLIIASLVKHFGDHVSVVAKNSENFNEY